MIDYWIVDVYSNREDREPAKRVAVHASSEENALEKVAVHYENDLLVGKARLPSFPSNQEIVELW
jgi:hypothetical protein